MAANQISAEGVQRFMSDYREAVDDDMAQTVSDALCIWCHIDDAEGDALLCAECKLRCQARNAAQVGGTTWGES